MASTFELEIITPERVLLQEDVEMVLVRAVDGDLGIMPGHFPLITGLLIGVIKIRRPDDTKFLPIAASSGLMEVMPYRVSIVVTSGELPQEIDVERARAAMERAEERLEQAGETDRTRAEAALQRAMARLQAAKYKE